VSPEPTERNKTVAWTALRIAAGSTYFSHGAAKLFGWFGAETHVDYMSRFGIAGVIETFLGGLIIIGLFTRIAAFICSGEMAVAYFWMHWGGSGQAWWWENHGEIVMVYSFLWLFFAAWGAGPVSLDARRRGMAESG
jgi:putative oxidoreductase